MSWNMRAYASKSVILKPGGTTTTNIIQLSEQRPLRGRVIDKSGKPVEGAKIEIAKILDSEVYSDKATMTYSNGEFEWKQAPIQETFYQISAPGFVPRIYQWNNNGEQVTAVIRKSPTAVRQIRGNVVDAATNAPITNYFYSEFSEDSDDFIPKWIEDDPSGTFAIPHPRFWNTDIFDPEISPRHRVMVGAPGYETTLSRRMSKHEFGTRVAFRLKRLPGTAKLHGTKVYHPDGSLAKNVPVLIRAFHPYDRRSYSIYPTGTYPTTNRGPAETYFHLMKTSDQGIMPRIALPPQTSGITILAPKSSLSLSLEDLQHPLSKLSLRPHGSLHGTLQIEGVPVRDREIHLSPPQGTRKFAPGYGRTRTDDKGFFRFEDVPTGRHQLYLLHPEFKSGLIKPTHQRYIEIQSNETTEVSYEIGGTTLTGRMISSRPDMEIDWPSGSYELKSTLTSDQAAPRLRGEDYVSRSRFEAAARALRNHDLESAQMPGVDYYLKVDPSGHFSIPGVAPGDYILDLRALETPGANRFPKQHVIASTRQRLTVPVRTTTLDLGAIQLNATRETSKSIDNTNQGGPDQSSTIRNPESKVATTRTLAVNAVDASTGEPVSGVQVSLQEYWNNRSPKADPPRIKAETNSSGQAKLQHVAVSADQLRVELRVPGYVAATTWFYPHTTPLPDPIIFRLYRGGRIHGLLLDQSGKPVAGVEPHITLFTSPGMDFVESQIDLPKTGSDGRWSYDGIPSNAESVKIEFRHPTLTYTADKTIHLGRERKDSSTRGIRFTAKSIREKLSDASPIKTVLTTGGQLRGQVLGPDETPLEGASVRIIADGNVPQHSNQWGWFEFPGSYSGHRALQVIAKGFAPKIIEANIEPNLAPLTITLEPSHEVRFKLVDPSKKPIANVNIFAMGWDQTRSPLGISGTTNEDGEWVMDSAPEGAVQYFIMRDGYHAQHVSGIEQRKEPHEIILTPALRVTFNVVDEMGQPIPRFSIQRGRLSPARPPIEWTIRWFEGSLPHGLNGTRSMTLDSDALEFDSDIQGKHIFRIEAFGYEPFVTRVVDEVEGPAVINVSMNPAEGTQALATTPGGRPISQQSILVSTSTEPPQLHRGSIQPRVGLGKRIKTDVSGRFILPSSTPQDATLLVTCVEGFCIAPAHSVETTHQLIVQPWASISGTLSVSGKAFPHQRIAMRLLKPTGSSLNFPSIMDRSTTTRDGSFRFEEVPPGTIELVLLTYKDSTLGEGRIIKTMEIEPGSNKVLAIDLPLAQP